MVPSTCLVRAPTPTSQAACSRPGTPLVICRRRAMAEQDHDDHGGPGRPDRVHVEGEPKIFFVTCSPTEMVVGQKV